jgi:hypothetical protein
MIITVKVARHAGSGRFVTAAYARRYPRLTVVETMCIRIARRRRLPKRQSTSSRAGARASVPRL